MMVLHIRLQWIVRQNWFSYTQLLVIFYNVNNAIVTSDPFRQLIRASIQ